MMLCVLISVFELSSDPTTWFCDDLVALVSTVSAVYVESIVPTVDADDSRRVECDADADGSAVRSSSSCGAGSSARSGCDVGGDSPTLAGSPIGSRGLFSLMEMTSSCKSIGVMCFSRKALFEQAESNRLSSGRALGMRGAV